MTGPLPRPGLPARPPAASRPAVWPRRLGAVLAACATLASPAAAAPKSEVVFGATFSARELKAKGVDWRKALDEMKGLPLKLLRIGAHWSEIEGSEGKFDFSGLDEVLDRADKAGYKVLLTVGMKAPRWPEYYVPAWAAPRAPHDKKNAEVSKDKELRRRALRFVAETVRHAAPRRAIVAWQVENEPMDRSGEKRWFIGADFLQEEAAAVRANDPSRRRVVVNIWCDNQLIASAPWTDPKYAVRNALRIGDVLGLDVYPRVQGEELRYKTRALKLPARYHAMAKKAGKAAWIIESQAEPWAPSKYDKDAMLWLVDRHMEQGYKVIFLWGFEWWYERKLKGDLSMWDAVKGLPGRAGAASGGKGPSKPKAARAKKGRRAGAR